MGRPRRVIFEKFGDYNMLHTERNRMFSGVHTTILYPIKETEQYYRSIQVWASCASAFKRKKKNLTLKVDIPVITNEKTVKFLTDNYWKDWVEKELNGNSSEMIECIALLSKLFPDKEMRYFYEFESIINSYQWGTFESFDDNGNAKPFKTSHIDRQKYYCSKYKIFLLEPEIKALYDNYSSEIDEVKKKKLFNVYYEAKNEYVFKHYNIVEQLTDIGRHSVCYPVAFSKGTATWYMEKYNKPCSYANAGKIHFVVTNDSVYFSVVRHY